MSEPFPRLENTGLSIGAVRTARAMTGPRILVICFVLARLIPHASAQTPACSATPLANLPIRIENIRSMAALGGNFPPSDIFPSPHMGFELKNDASPTAIQVPLYAPADITINSVGIQQFDTPNG